MNKKIDVLLENTADVALRRRAKWIVQNLDPQGGKRILDLGCGDGFYLHLLSNLNLKLNLYGVDYDKNALNSAKKNLSPKIKLVQADLMEKLPFPDNYFDGVIMSEVMEHLPDDLKGIKEARRVLVKEGKLLVSVPNINYPFLWDPNNWLLQRIFNSHIKNGFWAGIWNQHLRLYSEERFRSVIKKSGFKKIRTDRLTHYCIPFNHYLINLGARIIYSKNLAVPLKKVSKFNSVSSRRKGFNLFWLIFKFDKLNDYWKGKGGTVSLVASATK